jgi:hypothetical protein
MRDWNSGLLGNVTHDGYFVPDLLVWKLNNARAGNPQDSMFAAFLEAHPIHNIKGTFGQMAPFYNVTTSVSLNQEFEGMIRVQIVKRFLRCFFGRLDPFESNIVVQLAIPLHIE